MLDPKARHVAPAQFVGAAGAVPRDSPTGGLRARVMNG